MTAIISDNELGFCLRVIQSLYNFKGLEKFFYQIVLSETSSHSKQKHWLCHLPQWHQSTPSGQTNLRANRLAHNLTFK